MSSMVDIIWKICYHTVYIKIGGFTMKKRLSCIILTLVMIISLVPFAAAASDEATEAAEALYELGLFKGTGTNPDGTPIFDLDKTPTRNQAIIMLVRLLGKEEDPLYRCFRQHEALHRLRLHQRPDKRLYCYNLLRHESHQSQPVHCLCLAFPGL